MQNRKLLSVAEVAERLGLSEQTVLRRIHAGELAAVNIAKPPRFIYRIRVNVVKAIEDGPALAPASGSERKP
jgi:excisionase family DNA binding protein